MESMESMEHAGVNLILEPLEQSPRGEGHQPLVSRGEEGRIDQEDNLADPVDDPEDENPVGNASAASSAPAPLSDDAEAKAAQLVLNLADTIPAESDAQEPQGA